MTHIGVYTVHLGSYTGTESFIHIATYGTYCNVYRYAIYVGMSID
jgi:hypothetical protein